MQFINALNRVTTSHRLLERAIHRYKARMPLKQAKARFHFGSRNGINAIKEAGATQLLRVRLLVGSTALDNN